METNKNFIKNAREYLRDTTSPDLYVAARYTAAYACTRGFPSAHVITHLRGVYLLALAQGSLCGSSIRITSVAAARYTCATLDAIYFTQKMFTRNGTRRRRGC